MPTRSDSAEAVRPAPFLERRAGSAAPAPAAPPEGETTLETIGTALRDLIGEPTGASVVRLPQPAERMPKPTPDQRIRTIRERIDQLKARDVNLNTSDIDRLFAAASALTDDHAADAASVHPANPAAGTNEQTATPIAPAPNAPTAEKAADTASSEPDGPDIAAPSEPPATPRAVRRREEKSAARSGSTSRRSPAKAAPTDLAAEIAAIREELGSLRGLLDSTALATSLASLRASHDAMVARLDRIDRTAVDPAEVEAVAQTVLRRLPIAAHSELLAAALEKMSERLGAIDVRSDLARIEARLGTFDGAPATGRTVPADAHAPALARIEERLNQMAAAIEAAAREPSRTDAIGALLERVERIAARGEAAPAAIEALTAEIKALRDRESNGLAGLDRQIVALTKRIEAGLQPQPPETLDRIETKLAAISERIAEGSAASAAATIERLEELVSKTREQAMEAAREAVGDQIAGAAVPDNALLDNLRIDLRELHAAARANDRRTVESFEAVNATLDRIVHRLATLESGARASTGATAVPAADRSPGAIAADRLRSVSDGSRGHAASVRSGETNGWRREDGGDRKADFIAAARRAAQAAQVDHARSRGDVALEAEGAAPRSGAVARYRRPLLIAAGAIALAIAAVVYLQSRNAAEQNPLAPTATPAPVATTTQPAEVVAEPAATIPLPTLTRPQQAAPSAASPARVIPLDPPAAPAATPAQTSPAQAAAAPGALPEATIGPDRLRQAAASGDPAALFEVGLRYAEGRGVARNLASAAEWYELAAERSLAVAQYRLATLYESGQGVAEDRQLAHDWYLRAAEQGNIQAMHNLGVMLSQGIDGTPDFAAAIEWFTAAAEHGVRDSQYNLGVIYARGIGVPQDLVASYTWFAVAAAQGDTDAAGRRDDVAAALSPEQLAAGRAAVSAFAVQPATPAGNEVAVPEGGWDAPEQHAQLTGQEDLVRLIQALLIDKGFDPGPADGVDGPRTRDAVRAFQASIGAAITGEISPSVLAALNARA